MQVSLSMIYIASIPSGSRQVQIPASIFALGQQGVSVSHYKPPRSVYRGTKLLIMMCMHPYVLNHKFNASKYSHYLIMLSFCRVSHIASYNSHRLKVFLMEVINFAIHKKYGGFFSCSACKQACLPSVSRRLAKSFGSHAVVLNVMRVVTYKAAAQYEFSITYIKYFTIGDLSYF
jgi:hypothetical protein